jgi:glycosyltransferase involved in cell wall biosynthesis
LEKLKVSVVIPTYNREKCVIDLLHCLFVQEYRNFEIIVVDQSETLSAEKQEIIAQAPDSLKYYQISERGRSLAKNYGILFSTGDIILFCDDDIIVPTDFISTHVRNFDNPSLGALSCRLIEDGQPSLPIDKAIKITFFGRIVNRSYSTRSSFVNTLNGGNMSFRREALDKVGFFEEYFLGTSMVEEPDIAYRVMKSGYKIYFDASITVFHYPQYNGNVAEMKSKRAGWYYYYFYNLSIFYLKYRRIWNLFFLFLFCFLLSLKQTFKHGLAFKDYIRMLGGYFHGLKRGLEVSRISSPHKYYTPVRHTKTEYEFLKPAEQKIKQ